MYGSYLRALQRATRFRTRRHQFGTKPEEYHVVRHRRPPRRARAWGVVLPSVLLFALATMHYWGDVSPRTDTRVPAAPWLLTQIALGLVFAARGYASDCNRFWRLLAIVLALACVAQGVGGLIW